MVNCKRLLAMFLIFTLTFSNFAFAANGFISLFSSNKENENIEFSAYLANGDETSTAIVSDVNNENLSIKMQLDVKDKGYLKDGQISIVAEDGEELNFKIKEDTKEESSEGKEETESEEEVSEEEEKTESEEEASEEKEISSLEDSDNKIQSIENNIIKLRKIESSSDKLEISIPIEYDQEKYINEEKLMSKTKVILSGIYVDDDGDDNEISDEIVLTLSKLDIEVPTINEIAPAEITVLANKLEATTGKGIGEVKFGNDNWSYNEEEKKITIHIENEKELVKINESEQYLKEDEEAKEEERYYSSTGIDEYLVTYVYKNVEKLDELNINTKANAEIIVFSGFDSDEDNTIYASNEKSFTLTGQTGDIVSYEVENEKDSVSKVYGYLGQEIEFDAKTSINVSLTDLVQEVRVEDVENYYIDKSGSHLTTDDIYYKEIYISEENFKDMLGEEGSIEILDQDQNVLATINKDMEADENGNYVVGFENRISKIAIKTSAPVKTGNIILSSKKAMSNLSVDKNTYANMLEIATDTVQKVKLEYVTELAELDKNTVKIALNDTKTNFNLEIDRDSLSTVTTNSDVEMRLVFNNNEELSDIYGDSVFEIEMPSHISNVEITNASMVNGEGLELSNVESYVRDGKIIVKMTVSGLQKGINSGVLTNGTNIVLNMNIDVDMYTPAKDDAITVYGLNSQATNYADVTSYAINDVTTCGVSQMDFEYSGPSGVVAINSLSNYNDNGKVLTSVREGSKTDYLEIYESARNAKSEIVVINNYNNEVSNFSILGRLPFKGVKDVDSENELGTTINTPLAGMITGNDGFTIYYSENENATKDLENEENGWVTEIANLENVKSYLIVPNNQEYKLGAKEVLRFAYDYAIPEQLEPNQKIYGTFLVYYDNEGVEETSRPDLVGLSTGVGPELTLEVNSDKEQVKELEEFTITAKVTNTGEDLADNVKLTVPVPEGATYLSANSDRDSAEIRYENGEVVANMVRLEKDASIQLEVKLKVNEVKTDKEDNNINISARAIADNLRKEKTATANSIDILTSELKLEQYISPFKNSVYEVGSHFVIDYDIKNKVKKSIDDVKVEIQLPRELRYFDNGNSNDSINYDSSTNKITLNIGSMTSKDFQNKKVNIEVVELDDGVLGKDLTITSKVSAKDTESYNAKDLEIRIGRTSLSIVQTSATSTYLTEGYEIDYNFKIKNDGEVYASGVELEEFVPDGLRVREITYSVGDKMISANMSQDGKTYTTLNIPPEGEVNVDIKAQATSLDGIQEKTVTNEGTITDRNGNVIKSNSITHIVQANKNNSYEFLPSNDDDNNDNNSNSLKTTEITKTYKITGTAWLDANKNGMRDAGEDKMSGITALLVESNSGVIKSTTTTNSSGEYTFSGIKNGSYLVLFKYDTRQYTTTTYKKDGVDTSVNSDVVTTKIDQDGKQENAAVTDTIYVSGSNVENIDIGLVNATKFSLALDKSITKVTVQNEQGTKTENYKNVKLAKYEIRAKYLSGSTVYVEYTYKITNNGDLAGYASEIVDYIPEGMTFNSSLNKDWYTGTDGNLYTKVLENSELNVGESKEIKLVLTKQMTEENTGIVSNTAEIARDYNIYGVSDDNSEPANKVQNEDDMSTADLIISVGTGETLIYISAIITSLLVASAIGYIAYKKLLENKSKGGV